MALTDLSPFTVSFLLVFLVMAVIAVDNVGEFADLVLEMDGLDFGAVKLGIYWVSLDWFLILDGMVRLPLSFSRRVFILNLARLVD
jgi:hypothetical protein